jgi:hypothetical protein
LAKFLFSQLASLPQETAMLCNCFWLFSTSTFLIESKWRLTLWMRLLHKNARQIKQWQIFRTRETVGAVNLSWHFLVTLRLRVSQVSWLPGEMIEQTKILQSLLIPRFSCFPLTKAVWNFANIWVISQSYEKETHFDNFCRSLLLLVS